MLLNRNSIYLYIRLTYTFICGFLMALLAGCSNGSAPATNLPILGPSKVIRIVENGHNKDSLIAHHVPQFQLTNQYQKEFGSINLKGKIYITEFFFTSCPSVCPKVAKQMEAIHRELSEEEDFALVSITLDGKRDSPEKLYDFAQNKDVNHSNWYFLNGNRDEVMNLAWDGFFVATYEDESLKDDNIMHKGTIVLIDQKGQVRGMYDGKDTEAVQQVKQDVERLLKEV